MSTSSTSDRPSFPAAQGDDMSAVLARNWWAVALRGVAAILFGLVALFLTRPAILSLVLLFAAYMLVDAVFAVVSAIRAARRHERWGLLIVEAAVDLAAGVVAMVWPAMTVLAFVLIIAAWALVSGGFALAAAFRLSPDHGRGWWILSGVASIILGVLLLGAPLIGAVVLTWWIGAYALVFGVSLLVLAFRLRSRRHELAHGAAAAAA